MMTTVITTLNDTMIFFHPWSIFYSSLCPKYLCVVPSTQKVFNKCLMG